ncbi:replication fork protection component Swi3-domain-containing protein [Flagelloscypha sp. PMI_526]|nr:replication fork protection component Swi3-domain-containing protein [Flagelloscypha sp. PMI_526]
MEEFNNMEDIPNDPQGLARLNSHTEMLDLPDVPTRRLNLAEKERAANAKARLAATRSTQQTRSSSPPPSSSPVKGNGRKKDAPKEKRKPMKLDEARLLDTKFGIPKLIEDMEGFKVQGKGHEASFTAADLSRLLQVYQFWTHALYPKTQFKDTVQRVEKLCHSKRMQVALSAWRDSNDPNAPDPGIEEDEEELEGDIVQQETAASSDAARPTPIPPRSSQEEDAEWDDVFLSMGGGQSSHSTAPPTQTASPSSPSSSVPISQDTQLYRAQPLLDDDEEDAHLWERFNGDGGDVPMLDEERVQAEALRAEVVAEVDDDMFGDEDMWA